jgi:uncharacterized membrane protein
MTTCPIVCTADANECPTICSGNTTLCANGSCKEDCTGYEVSPCTCPSLPIACAKSVDYYDECFSSFQPFYESNIACLADQVASIPPMSYTGPIFIFCYTWISVVTALVIGWCYFNEKLCPFRELTCVSVHGMPSSTSKSCNGEVWTQTGYKRNVIGTVIYGLVLITFVGIQFLLFLLVILYYVQVGAITRWSPAFEDVEHVNKAFIMVWMIGFPWTMAFCFIPSGIDTMFLRRCPIGAASHVAVTSPTAETNNNHSERLGFAKVINLARALSLPITRMLHAIFSWPHDVKGHDVLFCPVLADSASGRRGLYHRLRRYVWDESVGHYVSGKVSVGETLQDFLNQQDGLSTGEVTQRIGIVGPNETPVTKPSLLRSLRTEFSKGFYVYQVGIHVFGASSYSCPHLTRLFLQTLTFEYL